MFGKNFYKIRVFVLFIYEMKNIHFNNKLKVGRIQQLNFYPGLGLLVAGSDGELISVHKTTGEVERCSVRIDVK